MIVKYNTFFAFVLSVGVSFSATAMAQDVTYQESRPSTAYSFSGLEGPVSDPRFDRAEEDGDEKEDDPSRFELQAAGSCNSCSGSAFTPSFVPLHKPMQGTWGYPECYEAENVLTQTQFFSLWHGNTTMVCLESVMLSEDWGAFFVLETQSGQSYVEITNDGLMRTGIPPLRPFAERKQEALTGVLELDVAAGDLGREYASCGFYPKEKLDKVGWFIDLMGEWDRLVEACIGESGRQDLGLSAQEHAACMGDVFDHFDRDASGALDYAELGGALYRAYVTVKAMGECASLTPRSQKSSQDKVADLANGMIEILDENGDLALSLEELSVIENRKVELFQDDLLFSYIALLDYFPFLKPASNYGANLNR